MKISKLLVIILIFLFRTPSIAQEQGLNKILELLQGGADTSFLIHNFNTHELQVPIFKIISKANSDISLYRYSNDKTTNAKDIDLFDVDTSKLFKLENINLADKELLWKKISSINPWDIKDDRIEGEGCPNKYVYHQSGISLYLITKGKIKKLRFYAPKYFQKACKKRAGRQSIIKLEKLFNHYFKD